MPDDTPGHPYQVSMDIAALAPKAEVTVYPWKEPKDLWVKTVQQVRDFLKAADYCSAEPERAARTVADRGYRYDYALQTLREINYRRWRDYDQEDAVRFYSLLLHEAGIIKSSPQKIISQGTDWRFFNELKRELKA